MTRFNRSAISTSDFGLRFEIDAVLNSRQTSFDFL